MAKTPRTIEGMITATIGIRVNVTHANWRPLGTIELPYKVRVYLQEAPTASEPTPSVEEE